MNELDTRIPMSYNYGPSPMEQMSTALTLSDMMDKRKIQQQELKNKEKLLPAQIEKANLENKKIESETAKNYSTVDKDKFDMQKSILDIAKSHVEGLNKETSFLGQQASAIDLNNPEQALQHYKEVIFPHADAFMFYDKSTLKKPEEMDLNGLAAFKKYATTQATDLALQETQAYHAQEAQFEKRRLEIEDYRAKHPAAAFNLTTKVPGTGLSKQQYGDLTKLEKSTEGVRSVMGLEFNKVMRGEAIESLINIYGDSPKDLNKIPPQQIEEVVLAFQNLLSPGQPSEKETHALLPKSAVGSGSAALNWLLNNPGGTNQGKFLKLIYTTIKREKATAQAQIKREYYRRIDAYPALRGTQELDDYVAAQGLDPDEYHQWIDGGRKPISAIQIPEGKTEKAGKPSFDDLWTKHGGK
jgi:hypothetical protein